MIFYKDIIKDIVEKFFTLHNCEIRKDGDLWEIKGEFVKEFSPSSTLYLAFSFESHRQREEAVMVTTGNNILKRILSEVKRGSRVGRGYVTVPFEDVQSKMSFPEGIEFIRCNAQLEDVNLVYKGIGRYLFEVEIKGEEVWKEIIPVFIDMDKMEEEVNLASLLQADFTYTPQYNAPIVNTKDMDDGYPKAKEILKSRISKALGNLIESTHKKRQRELKRLKEYYGDLQGRTSNKAEISLLEKSYKTHINELKKKFSISVDVNFFSFFLILVPILKYKICVKRKNKFHTYLYYDLVSKRNLPYICQNCGKETKSLVLCDIHGLECEKDGWVCPVCDEDRCSRCEYFECAIDGRKKDPQCTFTCQFCYRRVGIDHQVTCDVCGAVGCSECIKRDAIEGVRVCPDCGGMCSVCGKTYQNKHLQSCQMCPSRVCSICGIRECKDCGAKVCHQHSFKCGECGEYFCKNCLGGTDDTGKMYCKTCIYHCPQCGTYTSKGNARVCKKGGEEICTHCARVCIKCGDTFCKSHISRCGVCKEYVCEEDSQVCPSCGERVCKDHIFKCDVCGMEYCENCRVTKTKMVCNLCDSAKPIKGKKTMQALETLKSKRKEYTKYSNWNYAEGRSIYIFYGKSLLEDVLVVLNKEDNIIVRSKKFGLVEKIQGIFNK